MGSQYSADPTTAARPWKEAAGTKSPCPSITQRTSTSESTLRNEPGVEPIAVETLPTEVRDPGPIRRGIRVRSLVRHRRGRCLRVAKDHGQRVRHRLDFWGNRRLNCVPYTNVTQQRDNHRSQTYIDRKTAAALCADPAAKQALLVVGSRHLVTGHAYNPRLPFDPQGAHFITGRSVALSERATCWKRKSIPSEAPNDVRKPR